MEKGRVPCFAKDIEFSLDRILSIWRSPKVHLQEVKHVDWKIREYGNEIKRIHGDKEKA